MNDNLRNMLVGAAVVVVLGLGVYWFVSPRKTATNTQQYHWTGACLACKEHVSGDQDAGSSFPAECPKCKEKAAFAWYFCIKCKTRFIPMPARDEVNRPIAPYDPICISCRSNNVMLWNDQIPEHAAAKDAALPAFR